MDKQTFSSIQATTNTSRYAAAVFHKGRTWFCRSASAQVFPFVFPFVFPTPSGFTRFQLVARFDGFGAHRRFLWTQTLLLTLVLTDDPCPQVSFTSRR